MLQIQGQLTAAEIAFWNVWLETRSAEPALRAAAGRGFDV
jgi:hypothetical protein